MMAYPVVCIYNSSKEIALYISLQMLYTKVSSKQKVPLRRFSFFVPQCPPPYLSLASFFFCSFFLHVSYPFFFTTPFSLLFYVCQNPYFFLPSLSITMTLQDLIA